MREAARRGHDALMDDVALVEELARIVSGIVGPARMPAAIDADTPLGEGGLWLDSVDLLQVAVACEGAFGITFQPGEDLTGEGLRSLGTFVRVIRRRSLSP